MSDITLKKLNRLEHKPMFSVKDPVSALTHFIGFIVSIFLTPILLGKGSYDGLGLGRMIGLSVYCISMTVLYGASSAHHSFILPAAPAKLLRKFDHISIYLLIAGTYTPICLIRMQRAVGIPLVIAVWSIAAVGTVMKIFWINCPKFVSSIVYISMGWTAVFRMGYIYRLFRGIPFFLLLLGGLFYTAGGVIYATRFSISRDWSEHELFHLFILAGSLFHYLFMFLFVA